MYECKIVPIKVHRELSSCSLLHYNSIHSNFRAEAESYLLLFFGNLGLKKFLRYSLPVIVMVFQEIYRT